ncbi:DUF2490 domain-containing protein [Flavihumibacter solisilvae]|nr:DUF2490 domain-containing protein [Flavihumibacter solisilvae]
MVCIFAWTLTFPAFIMAQHNTHHQFWNEITFTRAMTKKFSTELNLGQNWTSTPGNSSIVAQNSQIYGRIWAHLYLNARWKFSVFYGYYYNKYVPEIDQREYPEGRLALQGTWYIKRSRLTMSTRFRLEDRHIKNTEGYYEGVYRFRSQLKSLYAFNGRQIRKGISYGIGSAELYFKSASNVTGGQFFDRTRLTIGGGYAMTDDIQVEVTYVNEYLPRPDENEIYHVLQIVIAFNNFLPDVVKKFRKKASSSVPQ